MTKTSQWDPVREMMKGVKSISFNDRFSEWFYKNPQSLLNYLSYYKFCAKMIGSGKKVLDINCLEGFGTYLLQIECGLATGLVHDEKNLALIKRNDFDEKIHFFHKDNFSPSYFDAIVQLEGSDYLDKSYMQYLKNTGLVIVGLGDFSNSFEAITKKAQLLQLKWEEFFQYSFIFSAQNETIRPGLHPFSNYYFFIGSKQK